MTEIQANRYFIYIRDHESYTSSTNEKLIKLGKCTVHINYSLNNRNSTYITGEIRQGKFITIIEILNNEYGYTNDEVEDDLHNYFAEHHVYEGAGTEFFKFLIEKNIEKYLIENDIPYKILTTEEVNELNEAMRNQLKKEYESKIKRLSTNRIKQKRVQKLHGDRREDIQTEYIVEGKFELENNGRCLYKAPTGFGKSILFYKTTKSVNATKLLILTPRKQLNIQMVDKKYTSKYISEDCQVLHFSEVESSEKDEELSNFVKSSDKLIVTACYESRKRLINIIKKEGFKFDLIFFDEAHRTESFPLDDDCFSADITKYRLFATATPTNGMKEDKYGKIIEKVNIYDLIKWNILCHIETYIKELGDQKYQYNNLKDFVVGHMLKTNRRKGIIFLSDTTNAKNLYDLLKTQSDIKPIIWVSDKFSDIPPENQQLQTFDDELGPAVLLAVQKVSFGYDNSNIDFICLADPKDSDIDIRQIIGRGLRWNKQDYPNKTLHLLVPLYYDEYTKSSKNDRLKKYLDFIIGECGQDQVVRDLDHEEVEGEGTRTSEGKTYKGESVLSQILKSYCTNGNNMFSMFRLFLRHNNVTDERSYNQLRFIENSWMPVFDKIREKYPSFCFRDIISNTNLYYCDKKEAIEALRFVENELMEEDFEGYNELLSHEKLVKINKINNKIPLIELEMYYPLE